MTARDARWGLLVKDIVILSTRQGMDWWLMFRDRFEPTGRIRAIPGTTTPQGDHCWVRCGDPDTGEDSQAEAEWLRDQMIGNGVPMTAVVVKRTPTDAAGEGIDLHALADDPGTGKTTVEVTR